MQEEERDQVAVQLCWTEFLNSVLYFQTHRCISLETIYNTSIYRTKSYVPHLHPLPPSNPFFALLAPSTIFLPSSSL